MTGPAYEEFVNSRLSALARYALMLTGDPHLAQDLVQETMVRVQLLRPHSDDEASWVPNDHAEENADRDLIWQALSRLPRQQRAALVLRYYEDLPDAEIAETLGCTVGTVRGYISRALASLRDGAPDTLITGGNR